MAQINLARIPAKGLDQSSKLIMLYLNPVFKKIFEIIDDYLVIPLSNKFLISLTNKLVIKVTPANPSSEPENQFDEPECQIQPGL